MDDWDDQDIDLADDVGTESPESGYDEGSESIVPWPLIAGGALALAAGLGLFWIFSSGGAVDVPATSPAADSASSAASAHPSDVDSGGADELTEAGRRPTR